MPARPDHVLGQVQQGRGRLRSRAGMRALLGCAVLAFFGTWVYCMVRFVDGEGSDYPVRETKSMSSPAATTTNTLYS